MKLVQLQAILTDKPDILSMRMIDIGTHGHREGGVVVAEVANHSAE
jgi:hypothetical protein